ncbi:hypothetical protein [Iodobacter fluviatilis]|nr:hypothetical protein [Iodobacter fluviatilis]
MLDILNNYILPACFLSVLPVLFVYLYLCCHLHTIFKDSYPQLLSANNGAMDSNIGIEFQALHIIPPLIRSDIVQQLPSQYHQKLCKATRLTGWLLILLLFIIVASFIIMPKS